MKEVGSNVVVAISLVCILATYAIPNLCKANPGLAQWLDEQGLVLESVLPLGTVFAFASGLSLAFTALGFMLLKNTGVPLTKGERSAGAVAAIMTILFVLTVAFVHKDFFVGYWLILLLTGIAALAPSAYFFARGVLQR